MPLDNIRGRKENEALVAGFEISPHLLHCNLESSELASFSSRRRERSSL